MEAMLQVVDQPWHQHWGHMGLSVSWGWITWEGISRRGYRWLMVCRVPTQTKTKVHTPSYCIRQNPVNPEQHLDYKRKPQSFWYQESCCLFADSTDSYADILTVQVFVLGMLCHLSPFSQKKKKKCKAARKHLFLDNTSAQADFLTFSACVWSVSHAERVWSDYHLDWTWPGIHLCTACFQAHSWLPDVNSLGEKICAAQEATRMSLF